MRKLIATAIVIAAAASPAAAQSADLARLFGARASVAGIELSPDGTSVSYLTPAGGSRTAVMIADIKTGQVKAILADRGVDADIEWCSWKSEARLICGLSGQIETGATLLGFSRLIAIDRDGGNMKQLGQHDSDRAISMNQDSGQVLDWLPDDPDNILMAIELVPERTIGTRLASDKTGLTAQKVNVRTGFKHVVESARREAWGLMTDGRGTVRVMSMIDSAPNGYMGSMMRYLVRPTGSKDWKPFGEVDLVANSGLDVRGLDESGDWVLTLKPLNGRQALYRVATDGSDRSELLFAHERVDVDGVRRVGKYGRPVAAAYTTDATSYHYLDPAFAKLSRSLGAALPGKPLVSVLDESWDGTRKLVFAGSDTDPGRYYVFDSKTRELVELTGARPALKDRPLSQVRPVSYPAADGTMIPAYLTLPPGRADAKGLPAIVMPHGGPAARDTWGFDWLPQYFAAEGYAVLQPNYRGSAGYGDAWYVQNGFKSWKVAVGDINDGARWLAQQGIAARDKLAIVGWSYGGYAALQANVVDPALYRAAVAIAPVTDLQLYKEDAAKFTTARLVQRYVGAGAHVAEGSPALHAAAIKAPVLLFHGDRDLNVNINQSRRMEAALKRAGRPAELVLYPRLEHSLVDSDARADMLRRSSAFLSRAMGVTGAVASAR